MDILSLLFPKYCFDCRKAGKYICESCSAKVATVGMVGNQGYAIWRYDGVIRKAILALKYKFASDIANELASLATERINNLEFRMSNCVLVPVPLHPKRERYRGFNQTEELGKRIAQAMNWDYNDRILIRVRHATPQARLTRHERLRNTRGIFAVIQDDTRQPMLDTRVIIFDDVWTTGATLTEAEKVLHQAGVKNITKLAVAK